MSVITISREFGSEGDCIARTVAQNLQSHLVDKKVIGHILGQYGYVEFDKEYETLPGFWERFDAQRVKQRDVMMKMLNRVIEAVARHGNVVILGRSGFEVLSNYADVLHVRVQAPLVVRIGCVMEEHNLSFEQSEELVKESDKVRQAFVEEFYKIPWGAINAFDLVVNTGKVAPELAAEWIADAACGQAIRSETYRPTTGSIVVDGILSDAVSETLGCYLTHR